MRIGEVETRRGPGTQPGGEFEGLEPIWGRTRVLWTALAAMTLLGAGLRFYRLGDWSFWIDEVYTIRDVRLFLSDLSLPQATSCMLTAGVLWFQGFSDWGARVVPALFGIITIPILYALANRLFGRFVGVFSALLLAVAPWHLFWSQNARFYTALVLFYLIGTYFAYQWFENQRRRDLILSGLFLMLAVLERLTALLFVPVIAAYIVAMLLWPFDKPAGSDRRNYRILILGTALFVLYQVYLAASGVWRSLVEDFGRGQDPVRFFLSIVNEIGIPLFVFALVGGMFLVLKGSRPALFLLVGALVPVIVLVAVAPFVEVTARYAFVTFPNWIVLAAAGARELLRRTEKEARILTLGALLVVPGEALGRDYLYFAFQHGNRLDWRAAFVTVKEAKGKGETVVSTRPPLGEHYLGERVLWVDVDLSKIEQGKDSVWFVIDYDTSYLPEELRSWLATKASLFSVQDGYLPGKRMRLRVFHYEPPSEQPAQSARR